MVKIIKNTALQLYVKIRENEFLKNVYSTNFYHNVLLVYITTAFDKKNRYSHSNFWECKCAGEIFRDLGYNVDVINYNTKKIPNIEKYSIVYGMGETFEKLFRQKTENHTFINYATGCNPIWSNIETIKKVRNFYKRTGKMLPESSRLLSHTQHLQILLSDKVIVLGDDFVKSTYLLFDDEKYRYENLDAFFFDFHHINVQKKNISEARKNFLWFGSSGALHKGLDVALDFFKENKELHLHICGLNINSESRFVKYYQKELYETSNIHFHGFLNLQSIEMKNVLEQCGYAVFPSVSEGGAVALLNIIANGGLIPVYSKSTGVPFQDYGFEFEDSSITQLSEAIQKAVSISDQEFAIKSQNIQNFVRENFTLDQYKGNLKSIISKVVHDNKD